MLIVFEGIDGSGKSSVLAATQERLADQGLHAEATSEFGRAEDWSKEARQKLLSARNTQEELHHVMAARELHHQRILSPLLAAGTAVLMDRYIMSTMAYQSSLTVSEDFLLQRHKALSLPVPDLTILIDLASETAVQRIAHRQDSNRIDLRPLHFFEEAGARFKRAAQRLLCLGWDVQLVNGELPLAIIAEDVAIRVMDKINAASGSAA